MAQLINNVLGDLSGKFGNVVFRKRGRKTYVACRPGRRTTSKRPHEIKIEKIFGLTGKISKTINEIAILRRS